MLKSISIAVVAVAAMAAAPAAAVVLVVPLGAIIVPPTQTFAAGLSFVTAGPNGANFQFTISQANTLTVSSFTNSSIGGIGVFDFTSIGLYSGFGTTGTLLQSGAITNTGNTRTASLSQFNLNVGNYTIAYTGNVTGPPAGVGSDITFGAGATPTGSVPEPATWAMMVLGFGSSGFVLRRRKKIGTRIRFA